jgi:SsrA-binding protein
LQQSYADVRNGEVWLVGAHIAEYVQGNNANHEPDRERKLLLHRREIEDLDSKVREKGLTLIPTRMYFKDGKAKVEIALGRGKKSYDKRQALAEKQSKREMQRALARRSSGKAAR